MQESIESHLQGITRSKTGGQPLVTPREFLKEIANGKNSARRVSFLLEKGVEDALFRDPENLPKPIQNVYFPCLNVKLNYKQLTKLEYNKAFTLSPEEKKEIPIIDSTPMLRDDNSEDNINGYSPERLEVAFYLKHSKEILSQITVAGILEDKINNIARAIGHPLSRENPDEKIPFARFVRILYDIARGLEESDYEIRIAIEGRAFFMTVTNNSKTSKDWEQLTSKSALNTLLGRYFNSAENKGTDNDALLLYQKNLVNPDISIEETQKIRKKEADFI